MYSNILLNITNIYIFIGQYVHFKRKGFEVNLYINYNLYILKLYLNTNNVFKLKMENNHNIVFHFTPFFYKMKHLFYKFKIL